MEELRELDDTEKQIQFIMKNFKERVLSILQNTDGKNLEGLSKNLINQFLEFLTSTQDFFSQYENYENRNFENQTNLSENEIEDYQQTFFNSFCSLLNDLYFSNVRCIKNNIPKTNLEEYQKLNVAEQLFHNSYTGWLGNEISCEGGDHSYWTLLFYNIFKELKDKGLDIDIKIFRFKNANAKIMKMDIGRYSGLIIRFNGTYYLVDHGKLARGNLGRIVKPLNNLIISSKNEEFSRRVEKTDIDLLYELSDREHVNHFFLFDRVEDFIKNVHKYSEHPHISLYIDNEYDPKQPNKKASHEAHINFYSKGIEIEVGSNRYVFELKNIKLDKNDFVNSFLNNVKVIRSTYQTDEENIERLKKYLEIIKDKIDLDKLCEYYLRNNILTRLSKIFNLGKNG